MATVINHTPHGYAAPGKARLLAPDPACQPCPDCSGLECLCRPRFFAGQLLSEQDLNRLDHYITEKHKLHNRHLFGSGVVCGLEVTCEPCGEGRVGVSSGYALSPCGEDIVVCKPDSVNICDLIRRCRDDAEPDCRPYQGQDPCEEVIEDWILAIRYAESPSRGVTALVGAGQGCCCAGGGSCSGGSCGCGGKSSCGCGGGSSCSCGSAKGLAEPEALRSPRLNRGAPPSCEPTVTCETYRYDVFRAPPTEFYDPKDDDKGGFAAVFGQLDGEMMKRIACCIEQLEAAVPPAPGNINAITDATRNVWFQWICQVRKAFSRHAMAAGSTDCELLAKLQAISIPPPAMELNAFKAAFVQAWAELLEAYFQLMVACICSNALPPCPSAGDPRVPLALVRVRKRDCQVVSICNWTLQRRHVLTWPTMRYWFGSLPIWQVLREWIHTLCCEFAGFDFGNGDKITVKQGVQPGMADAPVPVHAATSGPKATNKPMAADAAGMPLDASMGFTMGAGLGRSALFTEALMARSAARGGDFTSADLSAAINRRGAGLGLDPRLVGAERAAAVESAAASPQMGLMAAMLGDAAPFLGAMGGAPGGEVAELKATLARQSEEIAALRTAVNRLTKSPQRKPVK